MAKSDPTEPIRKKAAAFPDAVEGTGFKGEEKDRGQQARLSRAASTASTAGHLLSFGRTVINPACPAQ